jgi:site-specific DNA-methyltransferase (adenine-specific)
MSVIKKLDKGSIDLIITDPPYLIKKINGGGSINNSKMRFNERLQCLKENQDITLGYDIDVFADMVEYLQGDNINAYFWCNKAQIPQYIKTYVERLNCKFEILTWNKTNPIPNHANKYLTDTEYCMYFHKGKGKMHPETYNDAKTYWLEPINAKDKQMYQHPTCKPLRIIDILVRNSSVEGDTILDPFMGSGTTGVASVERNRKFIGCEINETYFHIANERINKHTCQTKLF